MRFTIGMFAILSINACAGPKASVEQLATATGHAGTPAAAELGAWGVDLSARKLEVAPGDDFFAYANGKWFDSYQLKADEKQFGSFRKLRDQSEARVRAIIEDLATAQAGVGTIEQKIGDFYASYMDIEAINALGIEPLRPDLRYIASIRDRAALVEVFARQDLYGVDSPIASVLGIDRKNPDRYKLNIVHAGLGLPDRDYYLSDDERFSKVRAAYEAHIARMLAFTGLDGAPAKDAARNILALETAIATFHWPKAELRDRDKTYNPYTIAKLESEFPLYPWRTHMAAGDIKDVDEVNVMTPSALAPLSKLVRETPLPTWKQYLAYHLVANNARLLSQQIDDANFAFNGKILDGLEEQRDRWKRGVDLVNGGRGGSGLGEAIGQVYVQRHFPADSKTKMERLVENLRRAYQERIIELPWMGEETKKQALAKLDAFRPKIGYPNKWRDFSSVQIVQGDLMANAKAMRKYWHHDNVSRLLKPTDKDEWFMTPQTVNAYYNPSFNEIVFPAAILEPPFFDPNADPAVNYGAIGAVIGHEMGHGFDDQGSKSDASGIQRDWWTEEDRARFDARTHGLARQYDAYEPIPGQKVDGTFTLGENIGDLGGLSIAYHAYKLSLDGKTLPERDGLNGYQRFFLAWAQVWRSKNRPEFLVRRLKSDPHSPEQLRVNGVVRNMDEWYQAFEIEEDDALYLAPQARVRIW